MATLLHIIAHPYEEHSQTMRIAHALIERYRETHPQDQIDTLDLYAMGVPHLTATHLQAMALQGDTAKMTPEIAKTWDEIMGFVNQLLAADKVVVTAPMWNFGVPSILKAYIDHIVLAGYTFRYTGPGSTIGMLDGRPLVVISTRGGMYSQPPMNQYEMCVHYLHNVFGFLGCQVAADLVAEGLALVAPHEQDTILQPVLEQARAVAEKL